MTDIWQASKEARPLALGFGGALGSPAARIQRLSSTIKCFITTFDDLYNISAGQQIVSERLAVFIQTLDECHDFVYDYAHLRRGLREFGKKKPQSEFLKLSYDLPRYVYTNDDIVNLEGLTPCGFPKATNSSNKDYSSSRRFFARVTQPKITRGTNERKRSPGSMTIPNAQEGLPAETTSETQRLYSNIQRLDNAFPQVSQTLSSTIWEDLKERLWNHYSHDDSFAGLDWTSDQDQIVESLVRYFARKRKQLDVVLDTPPSMVLRKRIYNLDEYSPKYPGAVANMVISYKQDQDVLYELQSMDVVCYANGSDKRFVVCTDRSRGTGVVHHLPSSIIYPFTKHRKITNLANVETSPFGNNEVSFVEPHTVGIVGLGYRPPSEAFPKYSFTEASDMLGLEDVLRRKHIQFTLEVDSIRSKRGPEAGAQHLKIWTSAESGQASMSFVSLETDPKTHFEFPITYFEQIVSYPTEKSIRIDFKADYKATPTKTRGPLGLMVHRASKIKFGFASSSKRSDPERSTTPGTQETSSSKSLSSLDSLVQGTSATIMKMAYLLISFSNSKDWTSFREVFKATYENPILKPLASSSVRPVDSEDMYISESTEDQQLVEPYDVIISRDKSSFESPKTSTFTVNSTNTTKPSSMTHSHPPTPNRNTDMLRKSTDQSDEWQPWTVPRSLSPEHHGTTFPSDPTPLDRRFRNHYEISSRKETHNVRKTRRDRTEPYEPHDWEQDGGGHPDPVQKSSQSERRTVEPGKAKADAGKSRSDTGLSTETRLHTSPIMFRVQGIPSSCIDGGTRHLIRSVLGLPEKAEITTRSLAVSSDPEELTAVVFFAVIPPQLSSPAFHESKELKLPIPKPIIVDDDDDSVEALEWITFDTHFKNLTILRTVRPSNKCDHMVDICAVSGLGGHAWGSFKEHGGPFMWLVDLLPNAFRGARIMTYGFDTKLKDNDSIQGLDDLGGYLLSDLEHLRPPLDSAPSVPLVFIAHSLGGLAVKESMIIAKEGSHQDFIDSIQALLFFGVPSEGMDIKSLLPIVEGQQNEDLLASLKEGSKALKKQSRTFGQYFDNYRKPRVAFFYENKPSRTAREVIKGVWKLDGPPRHLVTTSSATCGFVSQHGDIICQSLEKSHTDLVKFSGPNDGEYKHVLQILRQIVPNGQTKSVSKG